MAKKTLSAEFKSHDIAHGLQRDLLSFKKHFDEIYYRHEIDSGDSSLPSSSLSPVPVISAPQQPVEVAPASPPSQPSSSCTPSTPTPSLPDIPVSPSDTATSLISFSLKKPRHEVSLDQSIKQLCGGESNFLNPRSNSVLAQVFSD